VSPPRRRGATDLRIVLVMAPPRRARSLARALVERRLAACANVVPGVKSVYRWKGRVEEARESLLVVKTTARRLPALQAAVRALNPYEVPEVLALSVRAATAPYAAWVRSATR